MPAIEIELNGTELRLEELDSYEKIQIIKQAETVWVIGKVQLPSVVEFIPDGDYDNISSTDADEVRNPFEKYEEATTQFKEFLEIMFDCASYIHVSEDTVAFGRSCNEYPDAKTWADSVEEQVAGLPSQVKLEAQDVDIPSDIVAELEERHRLIP